MVTIGIYSKFIDDIEFNEMKLYVKKCKFKYEQYISNIFEHKQWVNTKMDIKSR